MIEIINIAFEKLLGLSHKGNANGKKIKENVFFEKQMEEMRELIEKQGKTKELGENQFLEILKKSTHGKSLLKKNVESLEKNVQKLKESIEKIKEEIKNETTSEHKKEFILHKEKIIDKKEVVDSNKAIEEVMNESKTFENEKQIKENEVKNKKKFLSKDVLIERYEKIEGMKKKEKTVQVNVNKQEHTKKQVDDIKEKENLNIDSFKNSENSDSKKEVENVKESERFIKAQEKKVVEKQFNQTKQLERIKDNGNGFMKNNFDEAVIKEVQKEEKTIVNKINSVKEQVFELKEELKSLTKELKQKQIPQKEEESEISLKEIKEGVKKNQGKERQVELKEEKRVFNKEEINENVNQDQKAEDGYAQKQHIQKTEGILERIQIYKEQLRQIEKETKIIEDKIDNTNGSLKKLSQSEIKKEVEKLDALKKELIEFEKLESEKKETVSESIHQMRKEIMDVFRVGRNPIVKEKDVIWSEKIELKEKITSFTKGKLQGEKLDELENEYLVLETKEKQVKEKGMKPTVFGEMMEIVKEVGISEVKVEKEEESGIKMNVSMMDEITKKDQLKQKQEVEISQLKTILNTLNTQKSEVEINSKQEKINESFQHVLTKEIGKETIKEVGISEVKVAKEEESGIKMNVSMMDEITKKDQLKQKQEVEISQLKTILNTLNTQKTEVEINSKQEKINKSFQHVLTKEIGKETIKEIAKKEHKGINQVEEVKESVKVENLLVTKEGVNEKIHLKLTKSQGNSFKELISIAEKRDVEIKVVSQNRILFMIPNAQIGGKIEIEVAKENESVMVKFQVEEIQSKFKLEEMMSEIKEELKQRGIEMEIKIEVKQEEEEEKQRENKKEKEDYPQGAKTTKGDNDEPEESFLEKINQWIGG